MKNFYYVVSINKNGKDYAVAETFNSCNNLLTLFERHKDAYYIQACESKKQAETIAEAWNVDYKNNGTYLFG